MSDRTRHIPARIAAIAAPVLAAAALAVAPAAAQSAEIAQASAALQTPDGKPAGEVTMHQYPSGVLIEVRLNGLAPGEHGIHIHETGACTPDFGAAGGHFNPDGKGHGYNSEDGPHAGDLPNIFVGTDGAAVAHFFNQRFTLDDGAAGLFDDDGAAVIVHEKPDTYGSDAGAGGRAACGVIEKAD